MHALLLLAALMAYPATIPSSPNGYTFGTVSYPARSPAFEYLGNQYGFVVTTPGVDGKLHAFKSTDNGQTWVEQDSAHAPTIQPPVLGPQYTVARDGSTALIFTVNTQTVAGNVTVVSTTLQKYNLSTDLWITGTTFMSPLPDFEYNADTVGSSSHATATFLKLLVRGAGDYILYYSGAPDAVAGLNYGRLWYTTFNGTTFGAPVKLPGQAGAFTYAGLGGVVDGSNRCHLFYEDNNGSASGNIYHLTLDGGLVFGANQLLLDSLSYWSNSPGTQASSASEPIIYTPSGGSETIAIMAEVWDDTVSFQQETLYYATTAVNPTFLRSVMTGGVDASGGSPRHSPLAIYAVPNDNTAGGPVSAISIAESNGSLVAAWCVTDNSFLGHYYYSIFNLPLLSWTNPALLFDAGTIVGGSGDTPACQIYAIPMAIGVGVFGAAIDDGTNKEIMQFDVVTITAPSPGTSFGNVAY